MKYLSCLSFALVAGLCLSTEAQAVERFVCELKAHTQNGLVPKKVLVEFADQRSAVKVYDPYIYRRYGEPISAQLEETGTSKYTLTWEVNNVPIRGNTTSILKSALRLNLSAMTASFNGYLAGYANHARGSGKCKPAS